MLKPPQGSFKLMLDLKAQKMSLESDITRLNGVHLEMLKLLQYYQGEVDHATAIYQKQLEDLKNHYVMIATEEQDFEIVLKLKQGQVEVQQAAVVTDYSDAVLFGKSVIEKRNGRIQHLGNEKVFQVIYFSCAT